MLHISNIKSAFLKALVASLLFILTYMFYNSEIIRSNIEDISFDIVNKFAINKISTDTNTSQVMIFAIDDLYMKENHLYDEYNKTNYGYLFPRDHISKFIESLDELCSEVDSANLPKALFIDYDMSFTSLPYGKKLSIEDQKLLDILKKERPYKILLPKTSYYNFIENSKDKDIQNLINNGKLIFVSVAMLQSSDGISRRYQSYKSFRYDKNTTKTYIGLGSALWQLMHEKDINLTEAKKNFAKDDIISNRIWIKSYQNYQEDDGCSTQKSYWEKLTKYSANCSLFDIVEEDFAKSIIMLGGTYTQNDDVFNILNVLSSDSFSGIDMHANALMTMLYLNGGMKRLSLVKSFIVVFLSFFILSVFISTIFSLLKIYNDEVEFIVLLVLNTLVLISISIYLLLVHQLWFNWFVPLVLFELVEIFDYIKDFLPKIISKLRRKK